VPVRGPQGDRKASAEGYLGPFRVSTPCGPAGGDAPNAHPRAGHRPSVAWPPVDHDGLLDGLSTAQRAAVTAASGPLCIIAGPGSGKTTVLSRRIAHQVAAGAAAAENVLALTFTRRAASELRHRLSGLGVGRPIAAGTFHAVALAQLRRWWRGTGQPAPTIVARRSRLLDGAIAATGGLAGGAAMIRAAETEISWAKACLVGPSGYAIAAAADRRRSMLFPDEMAAVYARYERDKRRRGAIDLDDLIWLCAEALERDTSFALAQRWEWRHFFVDEYQDVNPAHLRLLHAWLGDRTDLCVVGDPDQAIYGWNGSDPGEITAFARRFPADRTIRLDDNFRSAPDIVTVAEAVLAPPRAGRAPSASRVTHCRRDPGPAPTVAAYANEEAEAAAVSRLVRDRHEPGTAWGRQTILARTNAQLDVVARALVTAGIPHRIRGGRPLLARPAIRELIWPARPSRPPSASASLQPARVPIQSLMAEVRMALVIASEGAVAGAGPGETTLTDNEPPEPTPIKIWLDRHGQLVVAELEALAAALGEFGTLCPDGSVAEFVSWMSAAERVADGPEGDAVELATFHRAKGLEWDIVFIVGLEDGLVPLTRWEDQTDTDEERRLLYVAMTRARQQLHCSWPRQRGDGDDVVQRTASPFLASVTAVIEEIGARPLPADPRPWVRAIESALEAPTPFRHDNADPVDRVSLVTDLLQWRATRARVAAVNPTVVLADRTLDALVAEMPRTVEELSAVSGLSQFATNRWGDELVRIVGRHRRPA
jgi:DNA helicase-2/ATP-dependent DNA helicase PcrA